MSKPASYTKPRLCGVFLTLWDQEYNQYSNVLKPLKGGWPHLTLMYCAVDVPAHALQSIAGYCLDRLIGHKVNFTRAYTNSFEPEDQKGHTRTDILLDVDDVTKSKIQECRIHATKLLTALGIDMSRVYMRDPHCTRYSETVSNLHHNRLGLTQGLTDMCETLNDGLTQKPPEIYINGVTLL